MYYFVVENCCNYCFGFIFLILGIVELKAKDLNNIWSLL